MPRVKFSFMSEKHQTCFHFYRKSMKWGDETIISSCLVIRKSNNENCHDYLGMIKKQENLMIKKHWMSLGTTERVLNGHVI